MRVLSAAIVLALAGCLEGASPAASEARPQEGTDRAAVGDEGLDSAAVLGPTTRTLRFELAFGTDASGRPLFLAMNYKDEPGFDLAEGSAYLLVEGRWTCASPECVFSIAVRDRNDTEVARGEGAGEMRLEHEPAPVPGRWGVDMDPKGVVTRAVGEIRVTQSPVPLESGFTAFG